MAYVHRRKTLAIDAHVRHRQAAPYNAMVVSDVRGLSRRQDIKPKATLQRRGIVCMYTNTCPMRPPVCLGARQTLSRCGRSAGPVGLADLSRRVCGHAEAPKKTPHRERWSPGLSIVRLSGPDEDQGPLRARADEYDAGRPRFLQRASCSAWQCPDDIHQSSLQSGVNLEIESGVLQV